MKVGQSPHRVGRFLVVCLQLGLLLATVYLFDVEGQRHFPPILALACAGFAVHAWLPMRFRLGFFLALSLAGLILFLGWEQAAYVIGVGAGLIGLCYLPVPLPIRILLLAAAGLGLVMGRIEQPAPFWPVLASLFMFRLINYVYDLGHEKGRPSLLFTLAYFCPLPNICFTLFPVLDFKTFRETYYDRDEYTGYQTGVAWMVRGLSHLLAYRLIKYYVLPAPYEVRDAAQLLLFLAANYALYLRISGWFHLITGILHLFGFNLPRTHDHYFLASSCTDIWRRINIYWKDFMMKVFFFPAFYALRRLGRSWALALAALWVFVATWLLHSYQTFWLLGDLPLGGSTLILWLMAGVLVAVNIQLDLRRAKQVLRQDRVPAWSPWQAANRSLRTLGMFFLVSLFWACWTEPDFLARLPLPAFTLADAGRGLATVLGVIVAVVTVGVAGQGARELLQRRGLLPVAVSFERSAALQGAALGLVLLIGSPQVAQVFGPPVAELAATLRQEASTVVEAARVVPGYYEELADAPVQAGPWLGRRGRRDDAAPADDTQYSALTQKADPLLLHELIPGWKGTLAGSPITINHLGMRDRDSIRIEKPADTCRIALIGSSVVMGYGVSDEQVFGRLLEDRLNAAAGRQRFELLNFGTGRSYAIQRRVQIDRKVFAFAPDALYYFAHQDEQLGPPRHLAGLAYLGTPLPYPCLTGVLRQAGVTAGMDSPTLETRLLPFGAEIVGGLYRDLVDQCRQRGILPVWSTLR